MFGNTHAAPHPLGAAAWLPFSHTGHRPQVNLARCPPNRLRCWVPTGRPAARAGTARRTLFPEADNLRAWDGGKRAAQNESVSRAVVGTRPTFREWVGNGTRTHSGLSGSLLDPQSLWSRAGRCLRTQDSTCWEPFKAEVVRRSALPRGGWWDRVSRSRSLGTGRVKADP